MSIRVTRHFVTVGSRRVHYMRAGAGPAVSLLHSSPCSAKVLRLPMEVFASRMTAFAFDTPGYGMSDKLPLEKPEIEDFADALAEALAAMGVQHSATYGRHTGASIAVEFAARHPARCPMALTDGYPVFSGGQREERLRSYLVPLQAQWDGTHLQFLWFRYRDQHVFWPWNDQRTATRADQDVPDLNFLHRGVIELLEAGDGYRIAYSAAFRHSGLALLPKLKVPVCFGNRPGDSQFRTMGQYPKEAWTQAMPRDATAAAQAELRELLKYPAPSEPPPAPRCAPIPGRTTTDYVDIDGAQVLVRSMGDLSAGTPIVIIPHAPGSSAAYDELVRLIGARHPVLAFDLPGHGESDPVPGLGQNPADWARAAQRVMNALGIRAAHICGHNGGAAAAVELAHQAPGRVRSLVLDAPICLTEHERAEIAPRWLAGVAPVEPVWDGSHFARAFHFHRDMELWWPWYDRRLATQRKAEARINADRLTLLTREALKQPASFLPAWQAAMDHPMRQRLARTAQPCTLIAAADDVFAHCLPEARAMRPDARVAEIADTAEARAQAILSALG
ncbi:MAG: alpha/beta hydrolase [Alphaproteobacteria bacterium]|nr:alpha/beta hydrolase [Alphaproteobacteria bacterium]